MTTLAPQSAAKPASATVPPTRAREFHVRFAPRPGLISLFERPQNSVRWVGMGILRLDDSGIHVSARRLTLFGAPRATRFIQAAAIRHVFREGNAIRIDVQSGNDRWFFRFWTADADEAAELVDRLPTNRTIELDGVRGWGDQVNLTPRGFRAAWPLGVVALLAAAAVWITLGRTVWRVETPTRDHTTTSAPVTARQFSGASLPRNQSRPLVVNTEDASLARGDLQRFTSRFEALSLQFSVAFDTLQQGGLSQEEFAAGLEKWLLPQWTTLEAQLPARLSATGSVRDAVDQDLSAAVSAWRVALVTYAHGLRAHDASEVLRSFDYIKEARAHHSAAQAAVAELDTP